MAKKGIPGANIPSLNLLVMKKTEELESSRKAEEEIMAEALEKPRPQTSRKITRKETKATPIKKTPVKAPKKETPMKTPETSRIPKHVTKKPVQERPMTARPTTRKPKPVQTVPKKPKDLLEESEKLRKEIEKEFGYEMETDKEFLADWDTLDTQLKENLQDENYQIIEPQTLFEIGTSKVDYEEDDDPFEVVQRMMDEGYKELEEHIKKENEIVRDRTQILQSIHEQILAHPPSMFNYDPKIPDTKPRKIPQRPKTAR